MADAGTLSVNVTARIEDLKSKFDSAIKQANGFANRMGTIGNKDYFSPMQDTLKGMKRDLGQIVQGIILAQTFYQGIQLFKNLTAAVYEYTDALNYASVTFSNLFRDASLGEEFVAVLQQYAARSPFDFTDIEKGARQLAAYGIQAKNLMYVMQGIGNLSAVTGDPQTFDAMSRAIGQIYAKGKLSGEEMRQLAEAGLNVKAVYERLGVDASNVAKANIDAGTAINAIIDTLNDSYAGAMNAANMTMRGMIGNVKDVLLSVVSAIYQPAYEKMQRVLLGFQQTLNKFQDTFQTEGLAAAIEKTFGPEVLTRVQQVIAIFQYLGNTIYQLLVPALRILGMYSEACITIFGNLINIFGPILNTFAAFLNSILASAEGARLLQMAIMGLAVMKIVGGLASFLSGVMGVMTTVIGKAAQTAGAATAMLSTLMAAEFGTATGAVTAANAWRTFSAALNVNPIVLAITVILALIAAIVGLRNILGKTTDVSASLGGDKWSEYLKNIKQATGDVNKFNQALDKTENDVDDVNDELDKTKKKQEGLLSFDEVFKIPEVADTSKSSGVDDAVEALGNIPDLGDFELPEIEPLDFRDLLPDLNSLWDWISNWVKSQPWETLAGIITKGIASGIKKAAELPGKAAADLISKVRKVLAKELESFEPKIKEKVKELAEKVKEGKTSWEKGGKELVESLTKEIEEQLGPTKTAKLKVKEKLEKIIKAAEEGKTAWEQTGKKLVKELDNGITNELLKEKLNGKSYREQLKFLAEELDKAGVDFKKTGGKLANDFYSELASELAKTEKGIPKEWSETLAKAVSDSVKPKTIVEEVAEKFGKLNFSNLVKLFTTKIKDAFTPQKIMSFLKTSLKDMGITLIGEMLFDELANWLDENGATEAAAAVDNFGPIVASGIGTAIATKSPWGFVVGAIWGALFEALNKGLEEGDWTSMFAAVPAAIGGMLGKALSSGRLGEAFAKAVGKGKGSIWAMIGSIISDLLFGSIADSMEKNGDENGAAIMRGIGDCISGALGGASIGMLFGPVGAIAGAIIGALVAALVGHWGEISDWWTNTAVPWLQSLPNKVKQFLSDADTWLSDDKYNPLAGLWNGIKNVWKTISTFFKGLSELIIGFITGDSQLLHDAGYDLMDAIWSGITSLWNSDVIKFFKGLVSAIQGFIKDPISALKAIGTDIMKGLLNAAVAFFNSDIGKFFAGILTAIQGFIKDPISTLKAIGTDIMKGLLNAAVAFFNSDIGKFFAGILTAIQGFIKDPGKALLNIGNAIMSGFKDGIDQIWKNIKAFFSGILDWIIDNKGPLDKDRAALKPAGEAIINGLFDGIKIIWETVKTWFLSIPSKLSAFFSNAGTWLVTAGSNVFTGLKNGFTTTWTNIASWLSERGIKIKDKFSAAGSWLVSAGKNTFSGLRSGLSDAWSVVNTWLSERITKIKDKFSNAGSWLVSAGKSLFSGLKTGALERWSDVSTWLSERRSAIKTKFEYAKDWLTSYGGEMIRGFYSGIKDYWSWTTDFLSGIPTRIKNYFTYAKNWISSAGWNVIIGFYNSMVSAFKYVQDFVNGIAQWIIDHKGPESYDKKILIPAGNWIMEGLESGLASRFEGVKDVVRDFGPQLESAFKAPQLTVGRASVPAVATVSTPTSERPVTDTQVVPNPYISSSYSETSEDTTQRPILYVGTLIADKQGLRELKKKLDIVEKEQSRYR